MVPSLHRETGVAFTPALSLWERGWIPAFAGMTGDWIAASAAMAGPGVGSNQTPP